MTKPPIPTIKPVVPATVSPTPVAPTPVTPVMPPSLAPVSTPTPTLSPVAPSGTLAPVAPCCPDVATFEKSTGARSSYFAFDDTTTMVANAGADEYWIPPTKTKTVPADREKTRDGARWVSVGVGRETEVEINFGGSFVTACLLNCTFEFEPATLAEVTSPTITASGVAFKIKGKTAGEGGLKVMCDGKVRGYFHIWCVAPATINVDVASIVTPVSTATAYVVADLQTYLNEVFRQVCITVNVNDAGATTVAPTVKTYLSGATGPALTHLNEIDTMAQAANAKLTNNYRLYYYVNSAGHSGGLGVVSGGLGSAGPAYSFFDFDIQASYNTMAHELGHLLNLSHPAHDSDHDEFPAFQEANRVNNVLPDDAWNLMGYQGPVAQRGPNRKPLRYLQWKKCNRS